MRGAADNEPDRANLIMVYLLAVMIVAARFGRGPGIVASFLSVAAFDFFFVPPLYRFVVSDLRYLVTFGVMLSVAVVISTLTDRVRRQAEASRSREKRTAALLALSRELAATRELQGLLEAAVRQISEVFDSQIVILINDAEGQLGVRARRASRYEIDDKEMSVARWAFDHDQSAGLGTSTLLSRSGTA